MAAAVIACTALPAGAARSGDPAETSRGTVAIRVSVAAQARVTSDNGGICLWSNTATRMLAVTAADDEGHARNLTPADGVVAGATPGCATGGRLALATLHGGDGRTILVSPE